MSLKKSKLELLVRVRYSNPLPAPPCPPKLLDIPTNPIRYAHPDFLNTVANNTPLPMIVDAECGMPLDLGQWECLWEEDADDSELNPDPTKMPALDPKDAFLLGDPSTSASFTNGAHSGGPPTPAPAHVPWLRKTEYISREGVQQRSTGQESKHAAPMTIDISPTAQIRDIEASFAACNESFSLSTLRHPTNPKLTAVESYEIFPDADIWANAYDLFRFSERPGDRPLDVDDPRLDCAILRPMESDGDHFLAYYLTEDDESAIDFKKARFELAPYDIKEDETPTTFRFVRDYETVKVEQDVLNEFLLVFDDGESDTGPMNTEGERRGKGAYYKNIERKMFLKKKRTNAHEAYQDKWEIINLTHVAMSQEEGEERDDALAEVVDPMFMRTGDLDADGEAEPDEGGHGFGSVGEQDVETPGEA